VAEEAADKVLVFGACSGTQKPGWPAGQRLRPAAQEHRQHPCGAAGDKLLALWKASSPPAHRSRHLEPEASPDEGTWRRGEAFSVPISLDPGHHARRAHGHLRDQIGAPQHGAADGVRTPAPPEQLN